MKINLKNTKKLRRFFESKPIKNIVNVDTFGNDLPLKSDLSFDTFKLVNIYNSFQHSSFDKSKNITITYLDFSQWSNFLRFVFKDIETAYYPKQEKIYINKETLQTENNSLYDFMSSKGVSLQDTNNLIILHEMGHAVHHQSQNITKHYLDPQHEKANFINNFMSFTEISNSCAEIKLVARNATREGYADLYAAIMFDKLYTPEKSSQSENIITALRDFREYNHSNEHYYT